MEASEQQQPPQQPQQPPEQQPERQQEGKAITGDPGLGEENTPEDRATSEQTQQERAAHE